MNATRRETERLGEEMRRASEEIKQRSSVLLKGSAIIVLADPIDVVAVRRALEGLGPELYWCADAEQAIRAAPAPAARLFVIDMRMPGTREVVQVASRISATNAPVLAYNALRSIIEAGATETLPPPLHPVRLREAATLLLTPKAT